MTNDAMCKVQCGELHSELFGRRHSTLQSHGLFALAKRLFQFHIEQRWDMDVQSTLTLNTNIDK